MSIFVNFLQNIANYFFSSTIDKTDHDYSERFYAGGNDDVQMDVKRTAVKGLITFLDSNKSGRIDGYINFDNSTSVVFQVNEKKLSVGCEVLVDVTRNSKTSPWYASKMDVLSFPKVGTFDDWDETENSTLKSFKDNNKESIKLEDLPTKQVGMITYSAQDNLTLNYEINFRQNDCGPKSFRPFKGDWVVVEFDHSISLYRVIAMAPLRYIDFEGCISSLNDYSGFVDKQIMFNKSIIVGRNENFRRGMRVYGTAIESVQGRRCNFRALTIFPLKRSGAAQKVVPLRMRLKPINSSGMNDVEIKSARSLGLGLSTSALDFGDQSIETTVTKELIITNENKEIVMVTDINLSSETNNNFVIDYCHGNDAVELGLGKLFVIQVKCTPQFPGYDNQKLFITGLFTANGNKWRFCVDLTVYVFDPAVHECLETTEDVREKPDHITLGTVSRSESVNGVHLSAAAPVKLRSILTKVYPHKLKLYPIPAELEERVERNQRQEPITTFYPELKTSLNPGNYSRKMNLLVHLEEINAKMEMKQFVLDRARLVSRRNGTFGIEVPGLSEGRPSLMIGDKVNVRLNNNHGLVTYSGTVEDMVIDCVFVKFHALLHSNYANEECTVTFTHSRLPFRRMHLGIEVACSTLGDGILFPGPTKNIVLKTSQCVRLSRCGDTELSAVNFMKPAIDEAGSSNLLRLKFYNNSLNELQKVAVLRILHGYCRPVPYVLFGPPGTGKTVTLVEAILQVYKSVPSSRILLCAPSNSAADLLCLRLDESGVLTTGEMVRMNAYRRTILSEMSDKEPIPPRVLPYCKSIDELSEIAMQRIIICTCISSGALYRLGLQSGHFSHIFVDEAGQASEPEIMVALGLISPDNGQTVLAGDPMQLGPVIRSPHAQQLQESYLHRLLLSCELYQKQRQICPGSSTLFNPLFVTQLVNNYRAHPTLLKLPSDMFYDGVLVPCADKVRFVNWKWLPNPEMPFIFHGVRGKELRNQKNPSTYNPSEAVMVVRWIGRLLQDKNGFEKLEDSNISVITPYRAQVDCIRRLIKSCLEDVNLAKLKVASVEEFQGQENEVVIISTVRSSLDDNGSTGTHEAFDIVNTVSNRLGFLSNKRRFNVSITRACSLLIVIGDPVLLQYDECWSKLIKYAKTNGAYLGVTM